MTPYTLRPAFPRSDYQHLAIDGEIIATIGPFDDSIRLRPVDPTRPCVDLPSDRGERDEAIREWVGIGGER